MHYRNTTLAYDNELKESMKVEGAMSKDIFYYLFDVGVGKLLSEKGKKHHLELFEKWDTEHIQFDEDCNDYLDNHGLEDIIRDEGMQNLNNDD